jgi:lysophospholipase L1-like esterase
MLRRDGLPCPTLFAEDGLHLSAEGYQLWTKNVRAYRLPLFAP